MKALVLLSSLGVITLLAEIFNFKKALFPIVILGLVTTIILNALDWNTSITYFNMMRVDNFAVAFTEVILVVALLWVVISKDFFQEDSNKTDHYALVLFSLVGAVILTSYSNMAMLFLGIEILSIPMYILAGSRKNDVLSNEAAFKYLIMGAFATGFLLFGIVLIYGATGSFDLGEISAAVSGSTAIPSIFYGGVLLMLIGLSFKVSAAPFHFWTPDVYQGAPVEVTSFMATVVKTAAFAAFVRLFLTSFSTTGANWHQIICVIAAVTMLVGNITAVFQTSTKRMLAYSSVAHAGYMLLGLLAANSLSSSAVLTYATAYSIASIGTFGIVAIIFYSKQTDGVEVFNGLGKSNPFLAIVMTICLLSLAGIPPTAGFFGKYYIFTSAFLAGNAGLVLIAIIASLIGVYYYFKLIIAMYFKEGSADKIPLQMNHRIVLVVVAIATIAIGLFPDFLIRLLL